MSVNQQLREYVTRVGFSLSLSKAQISHLVFMDAASKAQSGWWMTGASHFIVTGASLARRGLIDRTPRGDGRHEDRLSKAGELVVELLRESGIYDDITGDLTVWQGGRKYVPLTELLPEAREGRG